MHVSFQGNAKDGRTVVVEKGNHDYSKYTSPGVYASDVGVAAKLSVSAFVRITKVGLKMYCYEFF